FAYRWLGRPQIYHARPPSGKKNGKRCTITSTKYPSPLQRHLHYEKPFCGLPSSEDSWREKVMRTQDRKFSGVDFSTSPTSPIRCFMSSADEFVSEVWIKGEARLRKANLLHTSNKELLRISRLWQNVLKR
ncbi:MAG: hypothetical protein H6R19_3201, partial [Proteobacteria bacterium]|nr:hypothetical protein [Pseudomonadota bacterium]